MSVSYARHALKVVGGAALALLARELAAETNLAAVYILFAMVFLLGLYLAVHGLFTGIEASVAAGVDGEKQQSES